MIFWLLLCYCYKHKITTSFVLLRHFGLCLIYICHIVVNILTCVYIVLESLIFNIQILNTNITHPSLTHQSEVSLFSKSTSVAWNSLPRAKVLSLLHPSPISKSSSCSQHQLVALSGLPSANDLKS